MNIWHLITFRIQLLFTPSVHFLGHHPIGGCDVHAGVRAEDSGKSEGEGEGEGRTVTNGPRHRHFRHLSPPGDIGDVIIFSPHTITRRLAVRGTGSHCQKVAVGMGMWRSYLSHGGCRCMLETLLEVTFSAE